VDARKPIKSGHESAVIEHFICWLAENGSPTYEVVERPDPPDAILKATQSYIWLEITDCYRSPEEAREEYSRITPGETPFIHTEHPIREPDARTAHSVLLTIAKKFTKDTYGTALKEHGPGILICCERDPLFSDSTLSKTCDLITDHKDELSTMNDGTFREVYLYHSAHPDGSRKFERILTFH
jgi:hypothetical protein